MISNSKTEHYTALVSIKVPRPDSLVEVRVTPPDSSLQVEVSPGGEVIELLVRPGAGLVEVRVSSPGENLSEVDRHLADGKTPAEYEVFSASGRAGLAARVEEPDTAVVKKLPAGLPDTIAEDGEAPLNPVVCGCRRPYEMMKVTAPDSHDAEGPSRMVSGFTEDAPVEFDWPYVAEPGNGELAQAIQNGDGPDENERPTAEEPPQSVTEAAAPEPGKESQGLTGVQGAESGEGHISASSAYAGTLALEGNVDNGPEPPAPATGKERAPSGQSAGQTLEWVPVDLAGIPFKKDDSIAPEVIDAAALSALARLNQAVREEQAAEQAAIEEAFEKEEKPAKPGEATIAAGSFNGADHTIVVEMYADDEPGLNPAEAVTPLPEDEIMDLGQMEKEAEQAIGFADANGQGEPDSAENYFAEAGDDQNMFKARPMARVIPNNTMVPE